MNRKAQRLALIKEARTIAEKAQAESRDLTESEVERAKAIQTEVADLDRLIKADDEARAALKAVTAAEPDEDRDDDAPDDTDTKSSRTQVTDRREKADALALGQAFVKSEAYQRFRKAFPSGVGTGSAVRIERERVGDMKALIGTPVARIQPIRYPTLDMIDRPRLTLLDIISRGEMAGAFEYVQITGVNRGAKIVSEATDAGDGNELKPLSDFTTALADAKPYTYADGYDVTNDLLADAPAFATFLNTELEYSLKSEIEDKLLNGTGTNGEPRGILNTTGVQNQAFDVDQVRSVRKGITKVTRLGGQVTAVVMSPEDDEAWDLLQDDTGRYLGQGPFSSGPGTAWGRPRIVSERLSGTGTAILGDFSTVALLDREGLSIEAFNQHKDYAQRNKVYVRAELRAGQVIWRPNRL
ncbi:phage major capsid protein, partial [Cellulosimicrobium sp. CpK407]|uniref:phage major capsid protein n=1 Tax=Cellulosimicrobium sp. CpK407 TaxID=3229847 RepID=UPI003F3E5CAC